MNSFLSKQNDSFKETPMFELKRPYLHITNTYHLKHRTVSIKIHAISGNPNPLSIAETSIPKRKTYLNISSFFSHCCPWETQRSNGG